MFFRTTLGKSWRKSHVTSRLMCCFSSITQQSYIIEQDLCESVGCLYDNWKSGQTFNFLLLWAHLNPEMWSRNQYATEQTCTVLLKHLKVYSQCSKIKHPKPWANLYQLSRFMHVMVSHSCSKQYHSFEMHSFELSGRSPVHYDPKCIYLAIS